MRLKPKAHRQVGPVMPEGFTGIRALIWKVAARIKLAGIYEKLWNPVNYGIVGGIGVVINYIINAIMLTYLAWYFSNALAILTAFVWNWANSVGPFGHYWGFHRKEERENQ